MISSINIRRIENGYVVHVERKRMRDDLGGKIPDSVDDYHWSCSENFFETAKAAGAYASDMLLEE